MELKNGKNLIIRKPREEDAKDILDFLNVVGGESNNLLFGKDEFTISVEAEIEFIRQCNANKNNLMILGIVEEKVIAIAQISDFSRKRIAHYCELSIVIKKEMWGLGIGTALMTKLVEFVKNHEELTHITLGVKADNHHAIELYKKFGFEQIGVHKDYFHIQNEYFDEILMDLSM